MDVKIHPYYYKILQFTTPVSHCIDWISGFHVNNRVSYLGIKFQITTMLINLETTRPYFQIQFMLMIHSLLCTKNGTVCWTN